MRTNVSYFFRFENWCAVPTPHIYLETCTLNRRKESRLFSTAEKVVFNECKLIHSSRESIAKRNEKWEEKPSTSIHLTSPLCPCRRLKQHTHQLYSLRLAVGNNFSAHSKWTVCRSTIDALNRPTDRMPKPHATCRDIFWQLNYIFFTHAHTIAVKQCPNVWVLVEFKWHTHAIPTIIINFPSQAHGICWRPNSLIDRWRSIYIYMRSSPNRHQPRGKRY